MDKGAIQALRDKYRSLAVRKLISALEKKESMSTISILSVMIMKFSLISTMIKWKFLTTRMTKVLKVNLPPGTEKARKAVQTLANFSLFFKI